MLQRPRQDVFVEYGSPRQTRSPWSLIARSVNWEFVAGFVILFGFFCWLLLQNQQSLVIPGTLGVVLVGWIFSLCLHEFAHAATAVLGGDTSPSTLRYLSFNPLHYLNPVLSIVLPVFFLFLGGIALPGGAVYLRRDLVRNRYWQSAISLAGPAMNALFFLGLMLPFMLGLLADQPFLAQALALLAFFQVFAAILNLLPIPPLDGFGAIAPWLPPEVAQAGWSIATFAPIVIFLLIWYVAPVANAFFSLIYGVLARAGIDPLLVLYGFRAFQFWQQ
ncbi:MAG TPA: site-2 protease family protein [Ktedonobacterales bacterium]|nr:site-2 protease family protein [Ktedonobacterales bacterium]